MELMNVIAARRTIRRYQQREVSQSDLRELVEAARLAPTGGNTQKLRFIIARNPKLVDEIFATTAWAYLVRPRRTPETGVSAPTAFIAITAPGEAQSAAAGAAIQNMMLRAVELGLGTCWIGSFKKDEIKGMLDVEEGRAVLFLLAVGHPDESPVMEDVDSDANGAVRYYLDDDDVLHVPKLTIDALTEWK